jgi:hypothetical protein
MIGIGAHVVAIAQGETNIVQTTAGPLKICCEEVSESSVVLRVGDGQRVELRLFR